MPPIRIPVKPRPPVPPGSAAWPPKPVPVPPTPGPGPRGEPPPKDPPPLPPPGDDGTITVTPWPPPPVPPAPGPTGIPPDWADAELTLRQHAGKPVLLPTVAGIRKQGEVVEITDLSAAAYRLFVTHVRFAGNRTTEPSGPQSAAKSASKETLLEQTSLSLDEKLDILAAAIETIGRDVAELKSAVLAPPPPADTPQDHWSLALAQTEEPAGLDVPLTSFDPVRAAEYAVWRRSPINGAKVGSDEQHARALTLVRAIYHATTVEEITDPLARRYYEIASRAGASIDVILWAPLVEMVDLWPGPLTHIDWSAVTALAGVYKQDGFHPLTWEDAFNKQFPVQGGTPGQPTEG